MTTSSLGWQHQFINTNRIRLHCITQGEGDLVVLLHGFPEFWYSWRCQIPLLARYFKVVVPDLRGYNDSDKPRYGYDLDTLSADIRGLIEQLGYTKAHIIGHDWGGTLAWHMAQTVPAYLDHLVVLNAPHPQRYFQALASNFDQIRRSWYLLAFQVPDIPEWLIQQNLRGFIKNLLQENAIRKGAFTARDTDIYHAALAKPGALSAALSYYRQWLKPQNWIQGIQRSPLAVTVPTLILWGKDDTSLSQTLLEGVDKLVSAPLQLKIISRCGHWAQLEAPQTVNRELLQFLRG